MTVNIYVHRDSAGRPWPPAFQHETSALVDIVKRMWSAFHHQPTTYALIGNVHRVGRASADLVIISEHGLGVIEMKNRPGTITLALKRHLLAHPDDYGRDATTGGGERDLSDFDWLADGQPIICGKHANPQDQVQSYMADIRKILLRNNPAWLELQQRFQRPLHIQSAVCFTHLDAQLDALKQGLGRRVVYSQRRDFAVLEPQDVPTWASTLRFELAQGEDEDYEPVSLFPEEIDLVATAVLGATKWTEIANLMPTGEPFGVLKLVENGQTQMVFRLDRDDIVVGRDPTTCTVVIPSQYTRVSKKHLHLWRTADGIVIEDLNSTNGTYIQNEQQPKSRLLRRTPLIHRQQIFLGGLLADDAVCLLEFVPMVDVPAEATEVAFWVLKNEQSR